MTATLHEYFLLLGAPPGHVRRNWSEVNTVLLKYEYATEGRTGAQPLLLHVQSETLQKVSQLAQQGLTSLRENGRSTGMSNVSIVRMYCYQLPLPKPSPLTGANGLETFSPPSHC